MSKYNSTKVYVYADNTVSYKKLNRKVAMVFDSMKEFDRYCQLVVMEKGGIITDLQRQVPFELIPSQRINGKVVERPCKYIADFVYFQDGVKVVEDTKGMKTQEYIIKRKLMLEKYGIRIREV